MESRTMAAKLATVDDQALACIDEPGAIDDIGILRSTCEEPQFGALQFGCGYLSPYFITDPARMEAGLDDAYILIHEKKISSRKDLLPLLGQITNSGKPLFIIAEDLAGEVLTDGPSPRKETLWGRGRASETPQTIRVGGVGLLKVGRSSRRVWLFAFVL